MVYVLWPSKQNYTEYVEYYRKKKGIKQ